MFVDLAKENDTESWMKLAEEVSPLFGCDLVNDEGFQKALLKNIKRGTAFCARHPMNPSQIIGGMLFSVSRKPLYEIGWFAVLKEWRRKGIGEAMMNHIILSIQPPAELIVTTFLEGEKGGESARMFYIKMGMAPSEIVKGIGPNGEDRQIFRKVL